MYLEMQRKAPVKICGLMAGCILLFAAAAFPQSSSKHSQDVAYKATSKLVLVPVSVTNSKGVAVNGLPRDAFRVLEDKVDRRISSFSEEEVPATIGFIFDLSGSMKISLTEAKQAFRTLLDNANPEDQGFLYTVSSTPQLRSDLTKELDTLGSRIGLSQADGSTALIDTIHEGLQKLKGIHSARKGLVIISDGMDNHSRFILSDVLSEAMEDDVQIYCLSLDASPSYLKPVQMQEARAGIVLLGDLSARTGGLQFVVRGHRSILEAAGDIGRALRSQYVIGYVPLAGPQVGNWRRIKVKVTKAGLQAHSRYGYYSN